MLSRTRVGFVKRTRPIGLQWRAWYPPNGRQIGEARTQCVAIAQPWYDHQCWRKALPMAHDDPRLAHFAAVQAAVDDDQR
jgi:hypothetical protein